MSSENMQEKFFFERQGHIQDKSTLQRLSAILADKTYQCLLRLRPGLFWIPYPDWEAIATRKRHMAYLGVIFLLITVAIVCLCVWGIVWSFIAEAEAKAREENRHLVIPPNSP